MSLKATSYCPHCSKEITVVQKRRLFRDCVTELNRRGDNDEI